MSTTPPPTTGDEEQRQAGRRRSMFVAAFGSVIEWYDFSIYFYVATILTREFFGNQTDSLILTLGVGAAGFLFRPLGAVVFGHIGDRTGRKAALVISAVLMAIAMLGTAALPGYTAVGIWGGVGMVLFRCLAGFSVGAEYTGIMVFLMESAGPGRRGFAASWAAANSEIGALLAVGIAAVLAGNLSADAMQAWGWRVLFVVGGLLALVMIPLRRMMVETDTVERTHHATPAAGTPTAGRSPLVAVLRGQPRAVLIAFGISTIGSVSYFLNITYVPTYLEDVAHLANAGSLALGTIAAVVAIVVTPVIGLASDRWGRRVSLGLLTVVIVATTIPAYLLMSSGDSGLAVFGAAFLAIPAAGWSAVAAATVPEQFTAVGRFSGMAVGYNVATVLFGGLSPLIATGLIAGTGISLSPAIYATVVVVIAGLPVLLLMRDMAGRSLAEVDRDREIDTVAEPVGSGVD